MGTLELKDIVVNSLKTNDANLLRRLVDVIENYKSNKNTDSILTDAQREELDIRRAKHFAGEGRTYTWKQVKQELIERHGLQA